jgi:hypothetical protein
MGCKKRIRSMIARGLINIKPHNNLSLMRRKKGSGGALVHLIEGSIKPRLTRG